MHNDEEKEKQLRDQEIMEENLRRLRMRNVYNKNPSTPEEEKENQHRLQGENTFISYEDLEKMAKGGEKFFLPPSSRDEVGVLSCGNGRLYKGSLSEMQMQLKEDMKNDPDNEQTKSGLKRVEAEIMARSEMTLNSSSFKEKNIALLPIPDTPTSYESVLKDMKELKPPTSSTSKEDASSEEEDYEHRSRPI